MMRRPMLSRNSLHRSRYRVINRDLSTGYVTVRRMTDYVATWPILPRSSQLAASKNGVLRPILPRASLRRKGCRVDGLTSPHRHHCPVVAGPRI